MREFDVILGMDCLGENLGEILCRKRMVHINHPGREPFVIYIDKSKVRSRSIMMMKARQCLTNGCTTFFAYVIDTKKEKKEMTDMPVVGDFPEVFRDD